MRGEKRQAIRGFKGSDSSYLVSRDRSQDQNQHVEAEVQGEVQWHVPQRSTDVVVAVVLDTGGSRFWGWWRWWSSGRRGRFIVVRIEHVLRVVIVRVVMVMVMLELAKVGEGVFRRASHPSAHLLGHVHHWHSHWRHRLWHHHRRRVIRWQILLLGRRLRWQILGMIGTDGDRTDHVVRIRWWARVGGIGGTGWWW